VRGDSKCTASNGAIWKGSPEGFKRRMENGTRNPKPQAKGKKGGKGKGGSTQRNLGKRKADDTSKLPCHNWSRGNGFCKYAGACRYSHDGPKGGSNQSTTMAVTTKTINKEKINKPSLVITEYESDGEDTTTATTKLYLGRTNQTKRTTFMN
jgi:hypothetical protein